MESWEYRLTASGWLDFWTCAPGTLTTPGSAWLTHQHPVNCNLLHVVLYCIVHGPFCISRQRSSIRFLGVLVFLVGDDDS